jgi:hypothetical protein
MTSQLASLFVAAPEPVRTGQLVRELLDDGVAASRIRVVTMHPERLPDLPAKVVRYRSPLAATVRGAALGALGGVAAGALLATAGFGVAPALVLVIAFAIGGALFCLWFGHGLAGELYRLDDAIRDGEVVLVLEVEDGHSAEIGRLIKRRHPDVAVLGADAGGTPPFP